MLCNKKLILRLDQICCPTWSQAEHIPHIWSNLWYILNFLLEFLDNYPINAIINKLPCFVWWLNDRQLLKGYICQKIGTCYAYRTSLLLFILLSRTRKCVHQEQSLKSLFFQLIPVSSRLKRDLLLRCCSGTTSLQYSCVCRSIQFKLWKRYKVWEYIIISLCKPEPVLDIIRIQLISASSTELTWFTRHATKHKWWPISYLLPKVEQNRP